MLVVDNFHSADTVTVYYDQVLGIGIFYNRQQQKGNSHFRWHQLRLRNGQEILHELAFKELLNRGSLIDIANDELLVDKGTTKHYTNALIFAVLEGNYNARAKKVGPFSVPNLLFFSSHMA